MTGKMHGARGSRVASVLSAVTPNTASKQCQADSYADSCSPPKGRSYQQDAPMRASSCNDTVGVKAARERQSGHQLTTATLHCKERPAIVASIIKGVESATGTGCESIVGNKDKAGNKCSRDMWTTR